MKLIEVQVLRKCSVKLVCYCHNYYTILCPVLDIFLLDWTGSPTSAGAISLLFLFLSPESSLDHGA